MATQRKMYERVLKKDTILALSCAKLPKDTILEANLLDYKEDCVAVKLLYTNPEKVYEWIAQVVHSGITFKITGHYLKVAIKDTPVLESLSALVEASSTSNDMQMSGIDDIDDHPSDSDVEPLPVVVDDPLEDRRNVRIGNQYSLNRPAKKSVYNWEPLSSVPYEINNSFQRRGDTKFDWSKIDIDQFGGSAKILHHKCMDMARTEFDPISCFLLAFPVQLVRNIVSRTNKNLENAGKNLRLSVQTFFKVIGMTYMICIENSKPLESHFKKEEWKLHLESYMKFFHYKIFVKHMGWSEIDPTDKWSAFFGFLNGVNERKFNTITPGCMVVLDESMCKWVTFRTGDNGFEDGMPHIQKLLRKPVPVGAEFRVLVDVTSGVILRSEVVKSKADSLNDEFRQSHGPSTAAVLRLLMPWERSGLIVIADSFFSSVATLVACLSKGLHFMGNIKIGRTNFPKEYFLDLKENNEPIPENQTRFMKAQVNIDQHTYDMMAACWYSKRFFVSSVGNNNISTYTYSQPYFVLSENGERIAQPREVPMAEFVKQYYSGFSKVDVHNHRRQGSLAMEEHIRTKNWVYRLINTTLGMIITDAYLIYKYVNKMKNPTSTTLKQLSFRDFIGWVANDLIKNDFIDETSTRTGSKRSSEAAEILAPNGDRSCFLGSMNQSNDENDKYRILRCRYCGRQTTKFCVKCKDKKFFDVVCCNKLRPECLRKHKECANRVLGPETLSL
jgi:Transposase IS4